MAQVRQQNEEFASAMISCYAEHGLEGTRTIGGGVVFLFESDDGSSPEIPPAVQKLMEAASEDCNERVPLPDHEASKALDDAAYERLLELRECIIAQGHEVPRPPSAEVWKDSSPWWTAWNPYSAMLQPDERGVVASRIPQDELRVLMDVCPQSGPTYYAEAPQ